MTVYVYPENQKSWTGDFAKICEIFSLTEFDLKEAINSGSGILYNGEVFYFDTKESIDEKSIVIGNKDFYEQKVLLFIEWFAPNEKIKKDLQEALKNIRGKK